MSKEECIEAMDFMKDWKTWRATIREGILKARGMGLSDETIRELGAAFADFLSEKVCPATPEEKLLVEMWDASNPDERKTLAKIFFKMLEKEK